MRSKHAELKVQTEEKDKEMKMREKITDKKETVYLRTKEKSKRKLK